MNKQNLIGSIMLLITAVVWGCAFVAQSEAMDYMQPFTFQAVRSLIGAAVLIPLILVMDKVKKKKGEYRKPTPAENRKLIICGVLCGTVFCTASMLQQFGINAGTSSGKAGFITAIYILLVPVMGIFLRKKVRGILWVCIVIALGGLWMLCMKSGEGFTMNGGDLLVLACAVVFALHIVLIDNLAPGLDGVRLSCIQFFVSAVLAGVCMFIFEAPTLSQLADGWITIAYAGVMSCGVAYTLQILGQQKTDPTVASMLMSFESVFAVVGAIVIQHQLPSAREWIGCGLMFCAIIIAQLPERRKSGVKAQSAG